MDHRKSRGSHRKRAEAEAVDFGNEPPLSVDGPGAALIDRRRVSLRWYCGTILNGLCGAGLMCGAVYIALDGEAYFAASPERVESLRATAQADRSSSGVRKTDRLPSVAETHSARQVLRVSTMVQVGEREMVRVRPFVRVAANLSLSASELSANAATFNPARLLASTPAATANPAAAEEAQPADEAEVSFVMRDLAPLLGRVKLATVLPIDDVVAKVREAANWTMGTKIGSAAVAEPSGRLAYAADTNTDPYAGFETRIVPENITLLPKTAKETTGGNSWNERLVVAKKGDTATTILRELGATAEEAKAVASMLGQRGRDGGLKEGQKLRVLLAQSGGTQRLQPIRVIVMGDSAPEMVVALSDTGKYVAVDVQSADTQQQVAENDDDDTDTGGVRLYQSVYETALRQQVPRALIDEIVRIYSYDVDFQRKVQPGDSFELLYPGDEEGEGRSEVLYAALTVGGESKRYYRFHTPDDGTVDYYDEAGKSSKKFLVRKPVGDGMMRSGYGWRRHPILGYSKMHTGVDWSAPRGTPIYASGTGVVEKVGWEGGYGKYVRIRHSYGYETAYGHMSAYARGIAPGARVQQGQVIGYVGSTGLSTGPHVHYEILVNGRFVDPMRIKLPRGRALEGTLLASFEKERNRVDAIMSGNAAARGGESAPVPTATRHGPRREAARR